MNNIECIVKHAIPGEDTYKYLGIVDKFIKELDNLGNKKEVEIRIKEVEDESSIG